MENTHPQSVPCISARKGEEQDRGSSDDTGEDQRHGTGENEIHDVEETSRTPELRFEDQRAQTKSEIAQEKPSESMA
jgi:hypothetical protein